MKEEFPEGVPLLSLLSIPVAPVPEEAAHLDEASDGGKAANPLEVQYDICLRIDGPAAVAYGVGPST